MGMSKISKKLVYLVTAICIASSGYCGSPPVIKEHPKSVTTRKNDPVTLNCAASEGSKVRWYRNGEALVDKDRSHRFILDNGSLFFLRVTIGKKENDPGIYWCEAYNDYGRTKSHNATLSVATIDSAFVLNPLSDVRGKGGDPLVISCRPPAGLPPPTVRWKHKGQLISNTSRIYTAINGDLVFNKIAEKDSGTYICLASNMAGSKESPPTNLYVIYSPWFKEYPQNLTAIAGTSVEFHCRVGGSPVPKISWRRLDGKIPLGRAQITRTYSLYIQDTTASDSGTYICEAKNEAGPASAYGTLSIVAAPVFKERPSNSVALVGEEINLNCQVAGDPTPLTIWRLPSHDQQYIMADQKVAHFSVSKNSFHLKIANSHFNDSGLYQCWGISSGGGVSSQARIIIVESFPPPLIGIRPQDQYVLYGSSVTFPCEVVSELSEATISWWFQRASHLPTREIVSKGTATILPTGALILKHITEDDVGIYKCKVKSIAGFEVEAEALLKIDKGSDVANDKSISLSAPPSKPRIMAYNSSCVQLSWLPNSRRNPNVKSVSYNIEYWRSPWLEWRVAVTAIINESSSVGGLIANVAYIFLVRAIDDEGESFPSPWSDFIYTTDSNEYNLTLEEERNARRMLSKPSVYLSSIKIMTADTVLVSWKNFEESDIEIDGVIVYIVCEKRIRTTIVLGEASSSHVHELLPNSEYTFFLVPFWRTIQGVPSNSKVIVTPVEAPKVSPNGLSIEVYESGIVLLQWNPMAPLDAGGEVIGYKISFTYNGSTTVHDTAKPWFKTQDLSPGGLYIVKVASVTRAGIGPWSSPEFVTLSNVSSLNLDITNDKGEQVPAVLYAPPHPLWILYLLIPAIILVIVVAFLLLRKFRRKSGPTTLEQNGGNNLYPDSSVFPHHQHVSMYTDHKLWRPMDSDKESSISSTKLLRPDHLINEYSEPRIQKIRNDTAEPYATTALLAPSTPGIGRSPASWRYGRCGDDSGIQVNWAAILPPPPSCPPPPQSGSCNSASTSSGSEHQRKCHLMCNGDSTDEYERPCDATSEHTYAAYSPVQNIAQHEEPCGHFSTLQGMPLRRVHVDLHPENTEPPKSNTH